MKFKKLAALRYSVRRFDLRPVEDKKIQMILEAGNLAPSAKNNQSWKCLVIRSPEALQKLKGCTPCHYNAPLAFLICYDRNETWKQEETGKDSGEIDAAIAATHMVLQACEIGVGSTCVMNFSTEKMKEEFSIPDNIIPAILLVCGYPSENAQIDTRHYNRRPLTELCRMNDYTNKELEFLKYKGEE